jgi:hypothetical protein
MGYGIGARFETRQNFQAFDSTTYDIRSSRNWRDWVALAARTLHSAIVGAAERLYLDRHYPQAVFEAGKALIDLVKAKSGIALDGAPLMQSVFSVNNPILAFNDLSDQSDRDEQQGLMHLYTGA